MSVILYPSGVTEVYKPKDYTFTDNEILHIFDDYITIRTIRLREIPNSWCVWGENELEDESQFNKLGSDIVQEDIFSPVLFIHDTELDPAWMLTDDVILYGYEEFSVSVINLLDKTAEIFLKQTQPQGEQESSNLLFLNTIGPTEDKRVLFEFDPRSQSQEFYDNNNFGHFANKLREYILASKNEELFYIYQDKKSVIYCNNDNVDYLVDLLVNYFKKTEKYEYCQQLKQRHDNWKKFVSKPKRKRKTKNDPGNN